MHALEVFLQYHQSELITAMSMVPWFRVCVCLFLGREPVECKLLQPSRSGFATCHSIHRGSGISSGPALEAKN